MKIIVKERFFKNIYTLRWFGNSLVVQFSKHRHGAFAGNSDEETCPESLVIETEWQIGPVLFHSLFYVKLAHLNWNFTKNKMDCS